MSLLTFLEKRVEEWTKQNCPQVLIAGLVQPCKEARHGHFQTNVAMLAAKQMGKNPREVAQQVVEFFANDQDLNTPQIAGPGFVNFTFNPEAIERAFKDLVNDPHFGIPQAKKPQVCVVDYPSADIAKPLHVGHIRSLVQGESHYRVLKAVGHKVISDNHIGDWGTQFGKILLGYKRAGRPEMKAETAMEKLESFYKTAHRECEADPELMNQARQELVKLQNGDEENIRLWKMFSELSQKECNVIYERFNVKLDYTLGESFYNPWLKEVVQELLDLGIARRSEGAVVVFFDDDEELKDHPFLIQKSDGASLYATTDLATVMYRKKEWNVDRLIYVMDGRQQLHCKQLKATARRWGYGDIQFDHAWFGTILGQDKKPLKTRSGESIKLHSLLDEAQERARAVLLEKRPDISEEKAQHLSKVIGIGAIKYADLAQNRNLDYVFDWNKLLAFDGNTAPYLINAYVRTRSILRKAGENGKGKPFKPVHDLDFELTRKLLDFGDVVTLVASELRAHHLCGYLYELASLFHRFFEHCPVMQAETESLKYTRLQLCDMAGSILARGLYLLGIQVVEEM